MIIPVGFSLVSDRDESEFNVDATQLNVASLGAPYERLSFSIDMMVVETGEVRGFSGKVLVDYEETDFYSRLGVQRFTKTLTEEHRAYLCKLRDHVDEVLGASEVDE